MPENYSLEDILPLLMSRQKQQQAEEGSKAAATLGGQILAPGLTDLLTKPRPAPGQPIPNAAGKIPPQDGMDPRIVPALRDIGMLGAGGAAGRLVGPMAEGAIQAAGRQAPNLSRAGDALKAITGGMALSPPDQAQAAGMKLPYDERVKLETQKRQREQETQAESERIRANAEAQARGESIKAQGQRDIEEQNRVAAALRAKQDREQPFKEKYSAFSQALPFMGLGLSTAIPALKGMLWNRPAMQKFVNKWEQQGDLADKALGGKAKGPATLAVDKLADYEKKWPGIEKRYTPGIGQNAVMGGLTGEMAAIPTEYDAMNQDPDSPSKPGSKDWAYTGLRSGVAGAGGFLGSKFGASLPPKVTPYVGGEGTISAYNKRYPAPVRKR